MRIIAELFAALRCRIGLHKWGEWVMLPYEDTAPYAHKRRVCERCLDDQVESDGE